MTKNLSIAVLLLLSALSHAQASYFSVDQWSLQTGITDSVTQVSDSPVFVTVTNPFVASHTAIVPPSTATASYNCAWSDASGLFRTDATESAAGNPVHLLSSASGMIWITPSINLSVSISASMTFNLPDGDRQALLSANIARVSPTGSIWGDSRSSIPVAGGPRSGTFGFNGSVIMPAGSTYVLRYTMRLESYSGNPNVLSTASDFVQFNITPEPAAVALLLPTAALLRLRRRRA